MNRFKAIPARIALAVTLACSTVAMAAGPEESFIAENNAAMGGMMQAMNIRPTGDIDADFVAMMVPHHQAAIDMAAVYLRYGKDERLRRLAQQIMVAQKDEIAVMQLEIAPRPAAASTPPSHSQ